MTRCKNCKVHLQFSIRQRRLCADCKRISIRKKKASMPYLKKYGITKEDFIAMLEQQNYGCKICGRSNGERSLVVDHNHTTGAVRALLCTRCNILVGAVEADNNGLLLRVFSYILEHTKSQQVIESKQDIVVTKSN